MNHLEVLFSTDRVEFVAVTEELIPDYLGMVNDYEHVAKLIGSKEKTYTEEDERAWVRKKREENALVWSILKREDGAFVGNIELMDPENGSAELGIALTAGMQDQGYGTEAIKRLLQYSFESLGLHRDTLKVFPSNSRAIHVYESCGFREYKRTEDDVFMVIQLGDPV